MAGFEGGWGHKGTALSLGPFFCSNFAVAIVYARAPSSFQNHYFEFHQVAPARLPHIPSSPNFFGAFALSLNLKSNFRAGSPSTTIGLTTHLHISTSINPLFFQ